MALGNRVFLVKLYIFNGDFFSGDITDITIFCLYLFFVIEMCIILMNLTIGISISNIQDLRKNADGLRLVKEVLLQRYLESLLRLISSTLPLCGLLWR